MEFLEQFGENIQRLRKEAGISQEYFAELISVHRTSVGRIEAGKQFVDAKTLCNIANALHLEYSELFKFKNNSLKNDKKAIISKIIIELNKMDNVALKAILKGLEEYTKAK